MKMLPQLMDNFDTANQMKCPSCRECGGIDYLYIGGSDMRIGHILRGRYMEKWRYSDRIGMIADINFMSRDKIDNKQYFPVICPDCGNKAGHLFEHRYEAGKDAGGLWVWCSACHNYEHYRTRLPKWWKNPDFIEFGKLCHQPDYLEEHKDDIDKWVNSLLLADWSNNNVGNMS